jgi:flagellar biosynthesis protein FlhB
MSEDRTQPPSKRRRQLAREQGQVAHSPELTAAAGWLVALVLLGFWGADLAQGLIGLTRSPLTGAPVVWADAAGLVAHMRGQVMAVASPLGVILAGFAVGAVAAHQLQVRGLWAAALIAPDPARLWGLGRGANLAAGFERTTWALVKALVLAGISVWAIKAGWGELQRLGELEPSALAGSAGHALLQPACVFGVVMLLLGLADYGLRYQRFEAMLRTTPQEQREDQRVMEGDLSLRAKRRRLARAWRGDAPELLAGASLILVGGDGLTLVLAGGPPPRRVTVRTAAQGNIGLQLRRSAAATRLPRIDAPDLALRLARHATSGSPLPLALPDRLMDEVATVWPSS